MLIKVCGLRVPDQVDALTDQVDFVGFIFYSKSPRAVEFAPKSMKANRVGVFVDEELSLVKTYIRSEQLDIVQCHGHESPEYCSELRKHAQIIKAFGVGPDFDFKQLSLYTDCVDYFLFDTKTPNHGGSGIRFNWDLLEQYTLEVPFLLSGGIGSTEIPSIRSFKHPQFAGIDINSRFETEPGDKNIEQINTFIHEIRTHQIAQS